MHDNGQQILQFNSGLKHYDPTEHCLKFIKLGFNLVKINDFVKSSLRFYSASYKEDGNECTKKARLWWLEGKGLHRKVKTRRIVRSLGYRRLEAWGSGSFASWILTSLCVVTSFDRVKNDTQTGCEARYVRSGRLQGLRRFPCVERRSEERLTERVYQLDVEGRRDSGRTCLRWLEGVKKEYNVSFLELRNSKAKIRENTSVETI